MGNQDSQNTIEIKELACDEEISQGNQEIQVNSQPAGTSVPAKRGPGRPPGSKNKDTLFKELMTGQFQSKAIADIEKVYSVLFEKAHAGDMKAIKMVLDRVVPVQKAADGTMSKGGITVSITVGSMEDAQAAEIIEDAEYTEVVHED